MSMQKDGLLFILEDKGNLCINTKIPKNKTNKDRVKCSKEIQLSKFLSFLLPYLGDFIVREKFERLAQIWIPDIDTMKLKTFFFDNRIFTKIDNGVGLNKEPYIRYQFEKFPTKEQIKNLIDFLQD